MPAPAECVICGRILPLGGVLDAVGRPVHYVCRGLAIRDTHDAAQVTATKIRRGERPRPPSPLIDQKDRVA
jgi:hypothetical protein